MTLVNAFLVNEYRLLWESYGIEPPAPAVRVAEWAPRPVPEGESPFLVAIEGPPEPRVGFVVCPPIEFLRLRKEEEALWERMLQALTLSRDAVALIRVCRFPASVPDAALSHFLWALPPSLTHVVFFGETTFRTATGLEPAPGWQMAQAAEGLEWIATSDLATLTRDPNAKKEAWNHLKDLPQRLK